VTEVSKLEDRARRELEAIEHLARQISDRDARPVDRLGLAVRLERSHERLMRELVASARRQGVTWQQIGDQLGVPRQTAHRRYRR
jgi:CRP-like cAMP-binding protein